ncbi:Cytochrome p450 [Thalictrum thalictroides]|uniref:Cytochrome p450 n=1 Tax=Thalictrum thalictroides TaxID=46969 RepID=A0A7J6V5U2_THATH|nr:Cytochrome p450 [Thalictrum thalictroides]
MRAGKMCFAWIGPDAIVNIMDPDIIRDILSSKYDHYEKQILPPFYDTLVTGIVSYNGEKWAKHRRIINPAFHVEKLKMMMPAFQTSCCEMIEKWQKLGPEELCELDVWYHLQDLTADVISRTAFSSSFEEGRRIFQLQKELAKLIIQATKFIFIPGFRIFPTKGNRRIREIDREINITLRTMILDREKAMSAGEGCSNDLLGQETTGDLLVWTMILLSIHQDWQEKAREEVLNVFGRRKPDFDGLNYLKIVSMILNEVLRLYPPAPTIANRKATKEMKVGGYTLPPGTLIGLPVILVHHDRDLWGEDAEEFNPLRFSEGVTKATNNKVSFIPFGWGTRICVGQNFALNEAKMAISMILQHFSFDLSPTYVHAPHTVITLQPQHGAQLILHKL